jgi:DNA repair protein RecN (Recombination protein N)
MLALLAVAGSGTEATQVFDEIDAGVGGQTGRAVGEQLRTLGQDGQVLCITHLPQIAAYGGSHFRISKSVRRDRTMTDVTRLAGPDREQEMARMIGGADISTTVLASAREMLESRSSKLAAPAAPQAPKRGKR